MLGKYDPAVAALRHFRNSILAESTMGLKVIELYYGNADTVNAALDRSPSLRAVARRMLEIIAPMLGGGRTARLRYNHFAVTRAWLLNIAARLFLY